jgi:hypothetical protein
MPAWRIFEGECVIRLFDVVGLDSGTTPEFTRHVGLAAEGRAAHTAMSPLPWEHMGPPLLRNDSKGPIHSLGSTNLTVEETLQVRLFIDELESEYKATTFRQPGSWQYVVAPHVDEEKAADGTTKYRKFSCAGFVIEAYREASIDLVTTNTADLPAVDLPMLLRQYPDQARALVDPRHRRKIGLEGDGPWRVVLAGYILNSLARQEGEIRDHPHRPEAGDEFFPTRRP